MLRLTLSLSLALAATVHAEEPVDGGVALTTPPVAEPTQASAPTPAPASTPAPSAAPVFTWPSSFTLAPEVVLSPVAYLEAYYAWNFNAPSNGITNFRGFDNRHNSFTLQNVALGAAMQAGPLGARLVFQLGSTPATIYLSEPALAGASGANASSGDLWKYVQEAFATFKAPLGRGLLFQLGLCGSPFGFEVLPVKDNWNWSRSDLLMAFPAYHVGLRATYEWTDNLSTTVSLFNGWNSVVDNNDGKSLQANVTWKVPDRFLVQLLYFGGPERARGAPEGQHWRHTFDLFAQLDATGWLSLAAQGDAGWEATNFGVSYWAGGGAWVRVKPTAWLFFSARGDAFFEHAGSGPDGSAAPIFFGGPEVVGSATLTADVRPHPNLSVRLEYRHDFASAPLFFAGAVSGDGSAADPYLANATAQNTLLLGVTTWF